MKSEVLLSPPTGGELIYTATITGASLKLRESRIIAGLLLRQLEPAEWTREVVENNVLQLKSESHILRTSRILRARLEPLGEDLWEMVRDGGRDLATQAAFASVVKRSRLLGDFMDLTIREQRAAFAKKLEPRMWGDYVAGCRGRDPDMPHWSDSTIARLRSAVFSMLAEVGYLNDTRALLLQNVFIDSQLATYLRERGETYVLRCLEVTA